MFKQHGDKLFEQASDILVNKDYLRVVSQVVSILTENISIQMESEYADALDRQLMALYGAQTDRPTMMDMAALTQK
jgi:hypothetical protein